MQRVADGKKIYLDFGAAWANDFGGFDFSFPKGTLIKTVDGKVYHADTLFFTLFDNERERGSSGRPGRQQEELGDLWSQTPKPRFTADMPPGKDPFEHAMDVADEARRSMGKPAPGGPSPDDDIPF